MWTGSTPTGTAKNNMEREVAEREKRSVQEYAQKNSEMGGNRITQGRQYVRGQTSSNTTRSIFQNAGIIYLNSGMSKD